VDDLVKDQDGFSEVARVDPDFNAGRWVRRERTIANLAMANIESNVRNLVRQPEVRVVHFSELNERLIGSFNPDALGAQWNASRF
jgi:hypothetical protein